MKHERFLLKRIRLLIMLFMGGTIISGLTAFPLEWEVSLAWSFSEAFGKDRTDSRSRIKSLYELTWQMLS